MSDHARWSDSAGAYVLGAMPVAEREAFEEHLSTCTVCRDEVDELRPAAEALPMASPLLVPPPALKDRIMAEVEREAALLAHAGPPADRPERVRRRRFGWLSGWRLAPAAAALVVAGVIAGSALSGPDTRTYAFQGQDARLEVEGDSARLVAEDLPAPPAGRVYEVWLKSGDDPPRPTSVLFVPRGDGSAVAAIPGSVSDVDQVLVTDEPFEGSDEPTGELLMSAELS